MLARIASLTFRRPKAVLASVGVFAVISLAFGYDVEHHLKAAGFTDPSSQSEVATKELRRALGYDPNPGIVVLIREKDNSRLDVRDPAVRAEVARLARRLGEAKWVGRVIDPLAGRAPPTAAGLVARDGRSVLLTGHLTTQDVESDGGEAADDAKKLVRSSRFDVGFAGFAPGFDEVNDQTRKDLTTAELIAFPALSVMLLLVFRGVIAAAIPLLIGVLSIVSTFLVLRIMAALVDTSLFALNIATALSLGLAVDYALLMVTRYREELARVGPEQAHRIMVMTAGRTSLFSGFTVAAAMAALVFFPQRFLYSVGAAGATVGIVAAVIAVLVVPSLLALLGPRVDSLSIRSGKTLADDSDGWFRIAHGVMRRAPLIAGVSTLLLLAAAAPLVKAKLTGPSAEAVPKGQQAYEVQKQIEREYGRGLIEPTTVAVRGFVDDAQLASLQRQIGRVRGVDSVQPFTRAGPFLSFTNLTARDPATERGPQDMVDTLRSTVTPPGIDVLVSGNTARFMDEKQSLVDNLPLVGAIVALSTLLLLWLLTGSVLLPIKTLIMNLMTLGATLGILVLAFQHGMLTWALGYEGPSAVEVTSLVFLFAVIFGLATDYAVLVMARIGEQVKAGVPNTEAVAIGIGRTGRVITAAAAMIAVVFAAFAVSSVFFMKQLAIGQALGVIIDATIVRALLVPSLMRLLGEWNWWSPAPLRRLHDRIGVSH